MRQLNDFYRSYKWRKTRSGFMATTDGLCENCKAENKITVGRVVHHIIPLTLDNQETHDVAYCYNNFQLLCDECHERHHNRSSNGLLDGYEFTLDGDIVRKGQYGK